MTIKQRTLVRQSMGLTRAQAEELKKQGYDLKFVSLGASDKDFYDVYL